MKQFNDEFIDKWLCDSRRRHNEAINDLQLCWEPLKRNFEKVLLIGGKVFDYF